MAETARATIYLDGKQAEQALSSLGQKAKDLRKQLSEAQKTGDMVSLKKINTELKQVEAAQKSLRKETFDYKKVMDNLSGASINDLRKALKTVESQMNRMNRTDPGFKQMQENSKRLRGEINRVSTSLRSQQGITSRLAGSFKSLLPAFGFAAIIAGLMRISRITIEFSKAQSNLAAVLGKTKSEIKDLTDDAIRYGSVTRYTATQVSELQTEFAKLGLTTAQIKASTKAALDLAAATNSDLAPAAKVTGVALKAFGLSAENATRVASAMAVATTKSALSFEDFETILATVGPVAASFGLTIEDTLALTGKLKDAGFDASSAATSTRNILLNLADSNGNLAKALGGPIKSLDELVPALQKLRERGIDLNETLQLTDKRSVAAFNTFLGASDATVKLRDSLIGVNDELQAMVDTQLDNLAGDVTILTSAWEGFILSIEKGDGVIAKFSRVTIQFFTDTLIKLSNIDLIFKRASKFSTEEVSRAYDAMLNLSGSKYENFQELVRKENKLSIDQVILRRGAMIQELRDLGNSRVEAEKLWEEFYARRKQQSIDEINLRTEEEKKAAERAENDRLVAEKKAAQDGLKHKEESYKKVMEALDNAHQERLLRIEQHAVEEKRSTEWLNLEKAMAERTYLEQKLAIMQEAGLSGIEIQRTLIQREIELIKQADDEIKRLREVNISEFESWLSEKTKSESDALGESIDENIRYARAVKKTQEQQVVSERETLANRADNIMAFTESIGNSFQDFLTGQNGSFEDFMKQTLLATLDFLEKMLVAAIAQETIKSIMEGAPLNPLAVAKAVGKIILLKAAFGIAKAAIMGKQKSQEFESGGYTGDGKPDEPAGVVHKGEWVAPAWQVKDPASSAIIAMLEKQRQNPTRINTAAIRNTSRGYNMGGFVSDQNSTATGYSGLFTGVSPIDQRQNEILEKVAIAVDKLLKWQPKVTTELIKKDLQTLDSIEHNRGM